MTDTETRTTHWNGRYRGNAPESLSWFEAAPEISLSLIQRAVGPSWSVLDVGGGASRLPDALLDAGHDDITVLDLSGEALSRSRARLGARADKVNWIVGDVTTWEPARKYDLWHDRGVFHFLTERTDREAYAATMCKAMKRGGAAIIMTFAEDGPETCSGLPVQRYSSDDLTREITSLLHGNLGVGETGRFTHVTPKGGEQRSQYCVFHCMNPPEG